MMERPKLDCIATPALLLDRTKLEHNIASMRERLARLGVPLRPHVKTAKCREAVRLALSGQPGGVAVSTLAEAADMVDAGVTDILYAVGITPAKLDEVASLTQRAHVTVVLDAADTARAVAARGRALGVVFPVLIEIDTDGHRAGLAPDDPHIVAVAEALRDGADLRGVMTHAGESYACRSTEAIADMAERERAGAVLAAQALRAAGCQQPVVSVGSTPTATFARDLAGVTEVRAGVYMFQDLTMAGLGVCGVEEIAISVAASVIGHQPSKGWVIVDAGWAALSSDRSTADHPIDQGYGLVCDARGCPIDDLIVRTVNQEHGIVTSRSGRRLDLGRFPVGTGLRILPNHACATAGMHDRYHLVEAESIVDVWERRNGWWAV